MQCQQYKENLFHWIFEVFISFQIHGDRVAIPGKKKKKKPNGREKPGI